MVRPHPIRNRAIAAFWTALLASKRDMADRAGKRSSVCTSVRRQRNTCRLRSEFPEFVEAPGLASRARRGGSTGAAPVGWERELRDITLALPGETRIRLNDLFLPESSCEPGRFFGAVSYIKKNIRLT